MLPVNSVPFSHVRQHGLDFHAIGGKIFIGLLLPVISFEVYIDHCVPTSHEFTHQRLYQAFTLKDGMKSYHERVWRCFFKWCIKNALYAFMPWIFDTHDVASIGREVRALPDEASGKYEGEADDDNALIQPGPSLDSA